jgi:hypothetical protein
MKRIHYAFLIIGLCWLTADLCLVISNISLRETPLGVIARFLDQLPPEVGNPIFILLWAILLLGWLFLIGFGTRPLFRSRKVN